MGLWLLRLCRFYRRMGGSRSGPDLTHGHALEEAKEYSPGGLCQHAWVPSAPAACWGSGLVYVYSVLTRCRALTTLLCVTYFPSPWECTDTVPSYR